MSYFRNYCLIQSEEGLCLLSSKSFMDLALPLTSLAHLELNFIFGIKQGSKFILLYVDTKLSQNYLLKDCSFPH